MQNSECYKPVLPILTPKFGKSEIIKFNTRSSSGIEDIPTKSTFSDNNQNIEEEQRSEPASSQASPIANRSPLNEKFGQIVQDNLRRMKLSQLKNSKFSRSKNSMDDQMNYKSFGFDPEKSKVKQTKKKEFTIYQKVKVMQKKRANEVPKWPIIKFNTIRRNFNALIQKQAQENDHLMREEE